MFPEQTICPIRRVWPSHSSLIVYISLQEQVRVTRRLTAAHRRVSMRVEEIVQASGQFFPVVQSVALDGTCGKTAESQMQHRFDEIRKFLVLQQRLECIAVQILGVLYI